MSAPRARLSTRSSSGSDMDSEPGRLLRLELMDPASDVDSRPIARVAAAASAAAVAAADAVAAAAAVEAEAGVPTAATRGAAPVRLGLPASGSLSTSARNKGSARVRLIQRRAATTVTTPSCRKTRGSCRHRGTSSHKLIIKGLVCYVGATSIATLVVFLPFLRRRVTFKP